MSYEKAMRHTRNVKKCRKQRNNYMGFDTGSGKWPSARSNPYLARILEINDWFKFRNIGSTEDKKHTRECIREAIADARVLIKKTIA